jgi:hypothetical protein
VVQVVVDKPLAQAFDYLWNKEVLGVDPEIGHIVEVPLYHMHKKCEMTTSISWSYLKCLMHAQGSHAVRRRIAYVHIATLESLHRIQPFI